MPLRQPHSRHGITLMEVLISMFVAAVGLMGLAALIPVGRHNIQEAGKSDRANAVARAAYREIKTRGWLKPRLWMNQSLQDDGLTPPVPLVISTSFQNWIDVNRQTAPNMEYPTSNGGAICIDPWFIGRSISLGGGSLPINNYGGVFPFALDNDPTNTVTINGSTYNPPRAIRVSLRAWNVADNSILLGVPILSYAAADRIFRNEDDKVFERPTDDTKRARAVLGDDNRMQSNGDYTWLATAVPISGDLYSVSVAVMYKRLPPLSATELTAPSVASRTDGPPPERLMLADFISGGIGTGGGDVRLRLPITTNHSNANPNGEVELSDIPKLRPGNWIMLTGWRTQPPPLSPPAPEPMPVYQWYRIVSMAKEPEIVSGEWVQDVTLDGPTWADDISAFADADTGLARLTVYAGVFENVVGVYTKTIEVDSWATP